MDLRKTPHSCGIRRVRTALAGIAVATSLLVPAAAAAAPPVVALTPVSEVGPETVTLNGTVDPGGEATDWSFEYGTTTAYGSSTFGDSLVGDEGVTPVIDLAENLLPSTTYHYRLTATNDSGTANSSDGTFTTSSAPWISSAGPLTKVRITPDLNCDVRHVADTDGEFFGDTACGTLLVVDGVLYGPADIPAGSGASPRTALTPVSQTPVTGSGSAADPYKLVTVADAGTSGVRVTQTDTYVVGQESYRTDIKLSSTALTQKTVRLYRAGDCYLQNSDEGYGQVEPASGAVACLAANEAGQPGTRIEQWFPLSAGSHYYHAGFNEVWAKIGAQQAFPDTCLCGQNIDNGAGLSWDITLPAGGQATRSSLITFSPLGRAPLSLSKTADSATTPAGGSNGYTITITNPNTQAVTLDTLTDTLPAGFSYAGPTTGATTSNPNVAGQNLTWSNVVVPASATATLHFGVTIGAGVTPGTYTNSVAALDADFTVAPTGETAPVTVTVHQPLISIGNVTVVEGNSGTTDATFAVTLSEPADGAVTVHWATANGTATQPADYTSGSGTVTFPQGDTSETVTVAVKGDVLDEIDETFTVGLSSASGAAIDDGTGVGTITDDDAPPTLSIDDAGVTEGDSGTTPAEFTVSLSAASGKEVTVNFATADGSAAQPGDYQAASGSVTFAPGQTARPLSVAVAGDTLDESDETFTVSLSGPANAALADGSGTGTIRDDDEPPPPEPDPSVAISDASVTEGDSGSTNAALTISLSAASSKTVTVAWATGDGSAKQPADYAAASGTATFAPGETAKSVAVAVAGDTLDEADESLSVTLSGPGNAALGKAVGTLTIVDDDEPVVEVPDVTSPRGLCGVTRRGLCKGLQAKLAVGQAPGNAVWDLRGKFIDIGKARAARSQSLKLARVQKAIQNAGTTSVRLRYKKSLHAKLVALLKRSRRAQLVLTVTYTPQGGAPSTQKVAIKLKRK